MSELNILTAQNVSIKFRPASVGDRIIATILDGVFAVLYATLVVMLAVSNLAGMRKNLLGEEEWIFVTVIILLLLPIVFYHLLSEYFLRGQSFGKKIMKLRVVKLDGTEPGIGEYLLRWLLRLVDFQLFSGLVAVIAVVATENNQRVGDLAAGTTVIKEEEFVPLEELRPVEVSPNHKVTFPQAEKLTDKDIRTLKLVLQRWQDVDDYQKVEEAAERLKESLGITNTGGLSDVDLIKVILADHAHLSHF